MAAPSNPINFLDDRYNDLIEDIKTICTIPSPTFHESGKMEFLRCYLKNLGFNHLDTDEAGNLIVRIPGKTGRVVVYSAHIDTVFPLGTDLHLTEREGILSCPSVCDNSTGIAALLHLIRYIRQAETPLETGAVFLFNVCEEELGNLKGIRCFFDHFDTTTLKAHICVEGHQLGRMTTRAVGSYRVRITIVGEGGHSWRDYGKPNAIGVAAAIINRLGGIELPKEPRTTMNFGTITGGTTVNTIAAQAEFTYEIRTLDHAVLNTCIEQVERITDSFSMQGITIKCEVLGVRPSGEMLHRELLDTISGILKKLAIEPIVEPGSTDANYPISLGLPSITIGITDGQKTHSLKESIDTKPLRTGILQLSELFFVLNYGPGQK